MGGGTGAGVRLGLWRWVLRAGSVLVLVAAVEYVVVPRLAGAERTVRLLTTVNPWWVGVAIGMEALSLVSYSLLSLQILGVRARSLWWMVRTDVAGLAVSHLVPAGAAAGNAVRYRLLRTAGISMEDASAGVTLEGIGSLLALLAVLWTALGAAGLRFGPRPVYVIPVAIGAIVVGVVVVAHRHAPRSRFSVRVATALPVLIPKRFRPRAAAAARRLAAGADRLSTDRRYLWDCAKWAIANWCFDAVSLWCFLAAFGVHLDPVGTLVAYAAANALGVLPVTPGGLGLVEGSLIPALIAFGGPSRAVLLGALSWRLVEFWVPIPVGGVAYLSLRVQDRFAPLPPAREVKA